MKKEVKALFDVAVESVTPQQLLPHFLQVQGEQLIAGETVFSLNRFEHIYLLAAGKAAAEMALETERILGPRITAGLVVTKYGHGRQLRYSVLTEAGHPIPDNQGVTATKEMMALAQRATKDDLVFVLLSGGASSLLTDIPDGISLDELQLTNQLLVNSGAPIEAINTVRKHLSHIKGGGLTRLIAPATSLTLIISDVVGNNPEVIASGPTVADGSTFADAMAVVDQYQLQNKLPVSVLHHLRYGMLGRIAETAKPGDSVFDRASHYIIGSNRIALDAAAAAAISKGYTATIVTDQLEGDYRQVANFIIKEIEATQYRMDKTPHCLLFGGEPTIEVAGDGLGGRNQHLALYLSTLISGQQGITILCAGTDGTDGPTDAAGAVVDGNTIAQAKELGLQAQQYLDQYDAYHFFEKAGSLIQTGDTGTNVMDLIIVLISSFQNFR